MPDPVAAVGTRTPRTERRADAEPRADKATASKTPKDGGVAVVDFWKPRPDNAGADKKVEAAPAKGGEAGDVMVKEVDSNTPTTAETQSKSRKGGDAGDVAVKEVDSKPPDAAGLMASLRSRVTDNPASAIASATANLNPETAARLI